MRPDEFISYLRSQDIILSVKEDNIAVKASEGALTHELIEDL